MPEEQPTPSESEANVKELKPDLDQPKASDSSKPSKTDLSPKRESTPTSSDSPSRASKSSQSENQTKETASPAPEKVRSSPVETKPKGPRPPSSGSKKGTKPSANSAQDETVGGSPIEALFTQIWVILGKIVGPILSLIGNKVKESALYSKLEPIFKVLSTVWNKLIVPLVNLTIKPLWGLGLKFLRGRFPSVLNSFSDRFLTIVILSFAALLYWLFSSLMPTSQPAAQNQPPPAPIIKAPASQPAPVTPPMPTDVPVAETPIEEPPPPPEPERKQIIEVQSQVAQVFDQYSQDIIQSVQVNFQAERLVIQVSDRWFELSRSEQNQLGTDALERSRKLDFPKLEIRDQSDQLLAREPVVGSNIIVLQRRTTPPELSVDSPV